MTDNRTEADSIADNADTTLVFDHPNAHGQVVVHRNDRTVSPVLIPEADRERPARRRGTVEAHNINSFAALFEIGRSEGSMIYQKVGGTIVAVLNDHEGREPGHGDDTIVLRHVKSAEFEHIEKANRAKMTHSNFAKWIDRMQHTIVAPDPATVAEVVRNFKAAKDVEFESGQNMRNGTKQLVWKESVRATAGEVMIPDTITFRVVPFRRETMIEPIELVAELRYQIDEGVLHLELVFHDIDDRIDELADTKAERVADACEEVVVFGSRA